MITNYAQIFTCPHCGKNKQVQSSASGSTFGQTVWSDNKVLAPMLPRASFVQKCPSCGAYYLLSRQKIKYGNDYSSDLGELSYEEMKEAWSILKTVDDLTENERLAMLMMLLWAYNDKYTRYAATEIPEEEYLFMTGIMNMLLEDDMLEDLLKAELLRESGRFDEAVELLENCFVESSFMNVFKEKFIELARCFNVRPFVIYGPERQHC